MTIRKCIHPIIAKRLITKFIEEIGQFTYEDVCFPSTFNAKDFDWDDEDFNLRNYAKTFDTEIIVKNDKDNNCSVDLESGYSGMYNPDYCKLIFTFEHLNGYPIGRKNEAYCGVRDDMFSRCKTLKGFSHLTCSILHEVGHAKTKFDLSENFDRNEAMGENLTKALNNGASCYEFNRYYYAQMEDEFAATEWAINWISNPENRKIAKAFERKVFECFE